MSVQATPCRVQLSRKKGWRLPENTVVVSRPSRWGNPFSVEEYGRIECLRKYTIWVEGRIRDGHLNVGVLRGKNLACWCAPVDALGDRQPCHADVLLELAHNPAALIGSEGEEAVDA